MARPREFDPDEAAAQAMEVFWRKGYEATSVQDLVEQTGVNRGSLYSVFGDKRSLFLEALGCYVQRVVPARRGILEAPGTGLAEIQEYFEAVVGDLMTSGGSRGCLMANTAVEIAPHDPEVARRVRWHLERLERAFAGALTRAAKCGDVSEPDRVPELASFLMSAAQGLMVVGKANPSPEVLQAIVGATLRAVH